MCTTSKPEVGTLTKKNQNLNFQNIGWSDSDKNLENAILWNIQHNDGVKMKIFSFSLVPGA